MGGLPIADVDPSIELEADLAKVSDFLQPQFFVQCNTRRVRQRDPPIIERMPSSRNLSNNAE
jgi:hypothetical protein